LSYKNGFFVLNVSTSNLLSFALSSGSDQVDQIKNQLRSCAASGQNINNCLRDLAVAIKPYMKTGVPELGIPQADPLFLDKISFDLKNPIIDVHVDFSDNFVTGLSDHELVSIEANKDEKTIEMEMFIPASNATGKYVIDGKVAVLVLDPYDPAAYRTEFTNTTVRGKAQLTILEEGGKQRLAIEEDPEMEISVGGLNIKMDNLFNGQADALAKTVDKFLNQNTDKFIKDFQPAIAKSVSGFLKKFYNSAVANIDVSVFNE